METKEIWTDKDFEDMSWHDSRLYQVKFPDEECSFTLYLDYIFKWVEKKDAYKFWVSPCELTFNNVVNLDMSLNFVKSVGVDIDKIQRKRLGLTPNGKLTEWEYEVRTDKGKMKFISTGFKMKLISQPILTDSQDLQG